MQYRYFVCALLAVAVVGSACATGGEPKEDSEKIREEPIEDAQGDIKLGVEYEDGPYVTFVAEQTKRCERIKEVTVEEDGETTTREEKVGEVDCGTKPAADIDLIVRGPERKDDIMQSEDAETFRVRLNQEGKARVRLTPGEWPGYHLVEGFATIECYGVNAECEPFEMTLPAEQGARFARASNRPDERARWLELYEGHDLEGEIRAELEEDERYKRAEEIRDRAASRLEDDELTETWRLLEECYDVLSGYNRCRVVEEKLAEAVAELNVERIAHLGAADRGGKVELYFGLVDADGAEVRAPGTVTWGLEADGAYREIATAEVTREDFESTRPEGADKERLVFVDSISHDDFIEPTSFESWAEAKKAFARDGDRGIDLVVNFEPLLQSSTEAKTRLDP